jgi:hypothetical protein
MINIAFLFVVSNLACVLIGWLLGRTGRNAAIAASVIEDEESGDPKRRPRPFQIAVVAMMVIAAVTAVNGIVISVNQRNITQCVRVQFDKFADALEARSKPQQEATAALDRVFFAVARLIQTPSPTAQKDVQDAILDYTKLRTAANKVLREHPYPDPPREACA